MTVKDEDYVMYGSTFPDGKRFYEMLHILERKKRYIIDTYIKLANPREWRRRNKEYNEGLKNKNQEESNEEVI